MATPAEPASAALQRIRARHTADPDGLCAECRTSWPCNTIQDADGALGDPVTRAINRARTAITIAEAQQPATVAELKLLIRQAIDAQA
jgi:hypothetical protein